MDIFMRNTIIRVSSEMGVKLTNEQINKIHDSIYEKTWTIDMITKEIDNFR